MQLFPSKTAIDLLLNLSCIHFQAKDALPVLYIWVYATDIK